MILTVQLIAFGQADTIGILINWSMDRGQPSNSSEFKVVFNKSEFKNLAQLIMAEYHKCQSELTLILDPPKSLSEAFQFIMVSKQKTISSYQELCKTQLEQLEKENHLNHSEHIRHAPEDELDILIQQQKKEKILVRVIDLKNDKDMQLNHLRKKYDQLLNEIKKMMDANASLSNINRVLDDEIRRKDEQLAKLKMERHDESKRYNKYLKKVQTLTKDAQILKNQCVQVRKFIAVQIYQLVQNWIGLFQQWKTLFEKSWNSLGEKLTQQERKRKQSDEKHTIKQKSDRRIINELIKDLSEAIGYHLRDGQPELVWLQHYRSYKRKKINANELKSYKQKVYMPLNLSEHDKFIARQKRFLEKYQISQSSESASHPEVRQT